MPVKNKALSDQKTYSKKHFSRNKVYGLSCWLDTVKCTVEHGERRRGAQNFKFPDQGPVSGDKTPLAIL